MTKPVPTLTSLITCNAFSHTLLPFSEFSGVGIQSLFLHRESNTHSVQIRQYTIKQIFIPVIVSFQHTTPDTVEAEKLPARNYILINTLAKAQQCPTPSAGLAVPS